MTFVTTFNSVFVALVMAYLLSYGFLFGFSRFVKGRTMTTKLFFTQQAIGFVHGIGWLIGLLYAGTHDLAAVTTFLAWCTMMVGIVGGVYFLFFAKRHNEKMIEDMIARSMVDYTASAGK